MEIKKEMGAKDYSLFAQIFAAVWICAWSAYKFCTTPVIEISDVIFSGASIAACFTPVYFSIIMDKIRGIRFGEKEV